MMSSSWQDSLTELVQWLRDRKCLHEAVADACDDAVRYEPQRRVAHQYGVSIERLDRLLVGWRPHGVSAATAHVLAPTAAALTRMTSWTLPMLEPSRSRRRFGELLALGLSEAAHGGADHDLLNRVEDACAATTDASAALNAAGSRPTA